MEQIIRDEIKCYLDEYILNHPDGKRPENTEEYVSQQTAIVMDSIQGTVSFADVLAFKTRKHYKDVGLSEQDQNMYNKKAQDCIAKAIYQFYMKESHSSIEHLGRNKFAFFSDRQRVIVYLEDENISSTKSVYAKQMKGPCIVSYY